MSGVLWWIDKGSCRKAVKVRRRASTPHKGADYIHTALLCSEQWASQKLVMDTTYKHNFDCVLFFYFFPLWGQPNIGADCPEWLWSLHSWRYLKAVWIWPKQSNLTSNLDLAFKLALLSAGWSRWLSQFPFNLSYSMILCSILLWCAWLLMWLQE